MLKTAALIMLMLSLFLLFGCSSTQNTAERVFRNVSSVLWTHGTSPKENEQPTESQSQSENPPRIKTQRSSKAPMPKPTAPPLNQAVAPEQPALP